MDGSGVPFTIRGAETNECPVSLLEMASRDHRKINPIETVQMFIRSKIMKDAAGATYFGPDLNEWPAKLVDAFVVLHQEYMKVESRMMKVTPRQEGGRKSRKG